MDAMQVLVCALFEVLEYPDIDDAQKLGLVREVLLRVGVPGDETAALLCRGDISRETAQAITAATSDPPRPRKKGAKSRAPTPGTQRERILRLLRAGGDWDFAELAAEADVPKASARTVLTKLRHQGLVRHERGRWCAP